ncbi:MAG: BON domain-containing protein [Gammaproteobacteria bacterium]|nr:BON domain-containing protein [Gammaproteobacteria bacterium]
MSVRKGLLTAGVSIVLAIGLAACEKDDPAESMGKSIDQAVEKVGDEMDDVSSMIVEQGDKAGNEINDSAITTKVKAAILSEPGLSVLQVNVDTEGGVVTLSGSSDSQENIERAKEVAGAVSGVKEVDNRMEMKAVQ